MVYKRPCVKKPKLIVECVCVCVVHSVVHVYMCVSSYMKARGGCRYITLHHVLLRQGLSLSEAGQWAASPSNFVSALTALGYRFTWQYFYPLHQYPSPSKICSQLNEHHKEYFCLFADLLTLSAKLVPLIQVPEKGSPVHRCFSWTH